MVAHFDWEGDSFDGENLIVKLNGFLPKDIAVKDIYQVKPDIHAVSVRFHAHINIM